MGLDDSGALETIGDERAMLTATDHYSSGNLSFFLLLKTLVRVYRRQKHLTIVFPFVALFANKFSLSRELCPLQRKIDFSPRSRSEDRKLIPNLFIPVSVAACACLWRTVHPQRAFLMQL